MRSKGIDMAAYGAEKGIYGASRTMQKGLANEVAAQAGNNAVSLPTMVAGAGQLATGNLGGAAATLGIMEALRRRGAGVTARAVDAAGGLAGRQLLTAREPLRAGVLGSSLLGSRESGGDPVLKPGYKFKGLFNQPEQPANARPNSGQNHMSQPRNNGQQNNGQNYSTSNFKHTTPKTLLKARQEKILTDDEAKNYLKKARGNRSKARQMAIADGWTIPQ
jgi:hypothetical protein